MIFTDPADVAGRRVADVLRRHGWTPFPQAASARHPARTRVGEPQVLAVRGGRILAVWVRTSLPRPSRLPDLDRFGPHVETFLIAGPGDLRSLRDRLLAVQEAEGA